MKNTLLFVKRNLKEMLRDPLLYVFCAGFPIVMTVLFQIIMKYTDDKSTLFGVKSLIPGIMMFSYSLLMLMSSLLVSKDRTSAFLKRLYTSPMKSYNYIIGYFIPYFIIGLAQSIICIVLGYIYGASSGSGFVSFPNSLLLIAEMLPIMAINILLGITFGIILNDKSAPAITSIFISCSGVLGGAWMPIDTMGDFETFATYLPFYPSVGLGRVITGACHTLPDELGNNIEYAFSENGIKFIIVLGLYLIASATLTILLFNKRLKSDN